MQNQPGTVDEYPNWRVPLGDSDGRPILLEDLVGSTRPTRLLRRFAGSIGTGDVRFPR
jgi:4-alpha-glucanotransferase